jgi:two-component system phosphate regulon sensor histidine kinase PhoR
MTKRIFRSIGLTAFAVFLASFVLIMGALYSYFSSLQKNELRIQMDLAAQGVEGEGAAYFDGLVLEDYRITWIAADGAVLYDSTSETDEMENHLERQEVQEALQTGYGESQRYSDTRMERSLYAAQLLADGTVLRMSISHSTIWLLMLGMGRPIGIIILFAAVLSYLTAKSLSKQIVKPLNALDLEEPLKNKEYDEIAPLLTRIDSQQKQLKQQEARLKEKEKELERSEHVRREFTANVSHELKTPLQSISGYSELIKYGMVKEEDIQPFAEKIYTEAQRLILLVEDILNLSHLDEGAKDLAREKLDLYELAKEVVQNLKLFAAQNAVQITVDGEPAELTGIRKLLQEIIYNLCDNAIKYNRQEGSVHVTVLREKGGVLLSVSDTGIGILPEHQDRIFERFYRVDKSHSKAVGGTGLGLSIVKHAAMIHGAAIEVDSTVGVGTTVQMHFPNSSEKK